MSDDKKEECSLCVSGDKPQWWNGKLWHRGSSTSVSQTLITCTMSEDEHMKKGEPEDPPSDLPKP